VFRAPVLVLVVLLTALAVATPAEAKRSVPRGFFGVVADGPLTDGEVPLAPELRRMHRSGVETVRVVFDWAHAQPYASFADVPVAEAARFTDVGGVPTDFTSTDRFVAAAAAQGIAVLPVVIRAPDWAADGTPSYGTPPRDPNAYAAYAGALAARYGPRGTFWASQKRDRPIRAWQIWNEPNLGTYWNHQPSWAGGYAALLRAAASAIRAAERRATIVTAGLTNGSATTAWKALSLLYAAGGKGAFDAVALHPYTAHISGVLKTVRNAREVMRRHRDVKPVMLTEVSWSSSDGDSPDRFATWDTTERGQARAVATALDTLARQRKRLRIAQVDWYTWLSPHARRAQWSDYAGLSRLSRGKLVRKPALDAFARVALTREGRKR
jgi:hypothetical protein